MSKLLDKVNGLFKKSDETEARYEKALEAKEQEVIALQADLNEKQAMLKDMHKMKLLGDISESAYDAEKVKVQKLQTKYSEANKELQLIQEYKTDDLRGVLAELEADTSKYTAEKRAEIGAIQTELLEAKQAYIEKMVEAKAKYDTIINPERKLDALKIKLGIKKNSYISDAHSALSMVSVGAGYENLFIENPTVYNALSYGRTPTSLKRAIENSKK